MKNINNIVTLDINDFAYHEKDKIKFVKGDIRDIKVVPKALESCSIVIHTTAAHPLLIIAYVLGW